MKNKRNIFFTCMIALFVLSVMSLFYKGIQKNEYRKVRMILNKDKLKRIEPTSTYPLYKSHNKYHYIVFYDSANCTKCTIDRMYEWNTLIENTTQKMIPIDFIFIFEVKGQSIEKLRRRFYQSCFMYPIYIDSIGVFRKENPQVDNTMYHATIIDNYGSIKMIGNAATNTDAANRFEKFLRLESR